VVAVPDKRLEKIAEIIKPEKSTPTVIEFIDIAGLIKNAHKGEGLGNQFLSQIRNCDALIQIVKCFGNSANPKEEIEIFKTELELKDLELKEKKLSFRPFAGARECKEKENLLSKKPVIYLFNTSNGNNEQQIDFQRLKLNLKLEEEISELSEKEKKELNIKSKLDQLILACYNILDLITFFTITGGKEIRAWTIKKNTKCQDAAGKVHSDFEKKFIRAETINWQKLIDIESWQKARELGLVKTVGRDYIVQDGDIIEFKI
jgi:ribosome-binding ATPase YchF (GTP1/OBG family)